MPLCIWCYSNSFEGNLIISIDTCGCDCRREPPDCEGLSANSISGEMSGASSASVNASQSIAVELSGTSSMTYSGQADISRSSASRLASIKRKTE